jgi:hypothetical protein
MRLRQRRHDGVTCLVVAISPALASVHGGLAVLLGGDRVAVEFLQAGGVQHSLLNSVQCRAVCSAASSALCSAASIAVFSAVCSAVSSIGPPE